MKTKLYISLFFSLFLHFVQAQQEWGEINLNQFDVKTCSFDTTAEAMVLYDDELISFAYEEGHFFAYYKRHQRIQILTKQGFERANVQIPSSKYETLIDIKAQTLNKGANGQLNKTVVDKKLIFNDVASSRLSVYKIAFPEVKIGSVIEYEYTVRSKYIRYLKDWYFQTDIPTLKSTVIFQCPYFLQYASILKSNIPVGNTTNRELSEKWNSAYLGSFGNGGDRSDVAISESTYIIENIPAIHEEKYVSCFTDYVSRMEFILTSVRLPNRNEENYAESWEDVVAEQTKSTNFGLLLGGNGIHIKNAKALTATITNQEEKLKTIYGHVCSKMRWNENLRIFPNGSLAKTYTEGVGNSADINMILVDMLRASGIKADPFMVKTRSIGKVQKEFPELAQFNHVIAYAQLDSNFYFLDATNPNLPYYLVDIKDLNDLGLRMDEKNSDWIPIVPNANSFSNINTKISFSPEGKMLAKTMLLLSDYEALNLRSKLQTQKTEETINELFCVDEKIEISNAEVENKSDAYKKLKIVFDASSKNIVSGDKQIYINPFPIKFRKENPFKLNERTYPINFIYPFKESIKLSIEIPDGYEVADMPKSKEVKIEDGSASFLFIVEKVQNYVQINSTLTIKQQEFQPSLYSGIKNIFSKAIDTYNSIIVLEKK